MNILWDTIAWQKVMCFKDNNLYVYKTDENPYFLEEEYTLIKCFLIKTCGEPDFTKAIDIYGKDLMLPRLIR